MLALATRSIPIAFYILLHPYCGPSAVQKTKPAVSRNAPRSMVAGPCVLNTIYNYTVYNYWISWKQTWKKPGDPHHFESVKNPRSPGCSQMFPPAPRGHEVVQCQGAMSTPNFRGCWFQAVAKVLSAQIRMGGFFGSSRSGRIFGSETCFF